MVAFGYLGDQAAKDFEKAAVTLVHYPDVGHYPMIEATAASQLAFEAALRG